MKTIISTKQKKESQNYVVNYGPIDIHQTN